jgi:hypothetical protein
MARPFHLHFHPSHPRAGGERPSQPAALIVILVLAAMAAVWMHFPPVASLLPVPPPG